MDSSRNVLFVELISDFANLFPRRHRPPLRIQVTQATSIRSDANFCLGELRLFSYSFTSFISEMGKILPGKVFRCLADPHGHGHASALSPVVSLHEEERNIPPK